MCATLTLNISKSALRALMGGGHFGWFDQEVAFEVRNQGERGGMSTTGRQMRGERRGRWVLGGSPAALTPLLP